MTDLARSDEQKAIQTLIEYLKTQGIDESPTAIYEPNGVKTPPDYSLKLKSHSVSVEIRNSGDGFLIMPHSNNLKQRELYERSAISMLDKIENAINTWLDPTETIVLTILGPVPLEKRGRLAKKIAKELETAYRSKSWNINQKIEFKVVTTDTEFPIFRFEAHLINSYAEKKEYSKLKTLHGASFQSPDRALQMSLSEQASYILQTAINEKSEKLTHIAGEKWLVLINNHPLLDTHLYYKAYDAILKQSGPLPNVDFSRIFLIDNGMVIELFHTNVNSN